MSTVTKTDLIYCLQENRPPSTLCYRICGRREYLEEDPKIAKMRTKKPLIRQAGSAISLFRFCCHWQRTIKLYQVYIGWFKEKLDLLLPQNSIVADVTHFE